MSGSIVIRGAHEHNLKNIALEIPRDKLVVITGVSGSGKSSLAFDTLYAEGQRRYVESLSAEARQFVERMARPEVDSIEGLSPAISIEPKSPVHNPRSTVGTLTEIYDYLRLLFARVGSVECHLCGREIFTQTIQEIVDQLLSLPRQLPLYVLAPIVTGRKGELRRELRELARAGFARVKIDGELHELAEGVALDRERSHNLDLVVDRLVLREGIEKRLADSLETASRYGNSVIKVETFSAGSGASEPMIFSQKPACVRCGISYPETTPSFFSFNSPRGACPACTGLGTEAGGGLKAGEAEQLLRLKPCRQCGGRRLRKESLQVKLGGRSIAELTALPIAEALRCIAALRLRPREESIGREIIKEIQNRLSFLVEVGLDYLTLDRPSATLSGGEAQRIRLATQIGSSLVGVLYILDEPSIGLHQRDNARLLKILKRLRDLGNTVLVVEHDRDTILAADHVIDMGPGAGIEGGEVVATGSCEEIMRQERSLTGRYLTGRAEIPLPAERRKGSGQWLVLKGARHNNLKDITVEFPVGAMTCVTGVSGSGKSSLVVDTLWRAVAQRLNDSADEKVGSFDDIVGWENFRRAVVIDQSPIGRTPRSNPATYTGLFDHLRELFAQLPEARVRGYRASRFSFNVKGGRCEACEGEGVTRIEMYFLPDLFVTCEVCAGRRYNRETLEVRFKGLSIAEILALTAVQALEIVGNIPAIYDKLKALTDVGLGYLRLGQAAPSLSGGEAQRMKLARELGKKAGGRSLYILDEPTTGLHFDDIRELLELLHRLIDAGNTIVMIEHNLDIVKAADYIVDLGPEGGELGGEIVACGTPEQLCMVTRSYMGQFLSKILA
jgi:excinuclease ABC subunit A